MEPEPRKLRNLVLFLVLLAVVALVFIGYPVFVIRPFRAQGEGELALSLWVRSWSFVVTAVCAVLAVGAASLIFQQTRDSAKPAKYRFPALGLALLTVAACALTRVNIFEKMFHPVNAAQFVSVRNAHLNDSDMVLAMAIGDQQRAYPVAIMAYHHILNDVLAGVPLAVTY